MFYSMHETELNKAYQSGWYMFSLDWFCFKFKWKYMIITFDIR